MSNSNKKVLCLSCKNIILQNDFETGVFYTKIEDKHNIFLVTFKCSICGEYYLSGITCRYIKNNGLESSVSQLLNDFREKYQDALPYLYIESNTLKIKPLSEI